MPRADRSLNAPGLDAAHQYLTACVNDGLVPAAVLEIGTGATPCGRVSIGTPDDAIFDLASLTKVLGTGVLATSLVGSRVLDLDDPVSRWVPAWRGHDRSDVRVRDLLSHASGLPAHLPLYLHNAGTDAFLAAIAQTPLLHAPRSRALYSDLGFIVIGRLLEAVGGASLDQQTDALLSRVSAEPPRFGPIAADSRVMPTGRTAWRDTVLRGQVHDDNAAAMGGIAGHAGLFGSARAVGDVARAVLAGLRRTPSPIAPPWAFQAFARRSSVPGSSRALAWDTALPTSSCGRHLSRHARGHTGFTGTSLWVDPERDLYIVLLTSRVAGRATAEDIARIRRAVHDIVGRAWLESRRD